MVTAPPTEVGGIQGFSAQRLQSQSHNIDRRVLVSIHHQPTMWAGMYPIRECFCDDHSTSGAPLRCIPGIHQDHTGASFFRFDPGDHDEHIPGYICNALCQIMILFHFYDVQILEHNHTKPIHQLPGGLMSKIEPSVGDPFVDACDDLFGFFPFRSSFLCF